MQIQLQHEEHVGPDSSRSHLLANSSYWRSKQGVVPPNLGSLRLVLPNLILSKKELGWLGAIENRLLDENVKGDPCDTKDILIFRNQWTKGSRYSQTEMSRFVWVKSWLDFAL